MLDLWQQRVIANEAEGERGGGRGAGRQGDREAGRQGGLDLWQQRGELGGVGLEIFYGFGVPLVREQVRGSSWLVPLTENRGSEWYGVLWPGGEVYVSE